jgi:DNA-binding XRE family transcriptional regulator
MTGGHSCTLVKHALDCAQKSSLMTPADTQTPLQQRPARPAAQRLGDRLRQLRVAAGMTQSDLAGERFSKEYVSQIERGKTRPTSDTSPTASRSTSVAGSTRRSAARKR